MGCRGMCGPGAPAGSGSQGPDHNSSFLWMQSPSPTPGSLGSTQTGKGWRKDWFLHHRGSVCPFGAWEAIPHFHPHPPPETWLLPAIATEFGKDFGPSAKS